MCQPISGDGNGALFSLRREPDGIYLGDGRAIPVAYDWGDLYFGGKSDVISF